MKDKWREEKDAEDNFKQKKKRKKKKNPHQAKNVEALEYPLSE